MATFNLTNYDTKKLRDFLRLAEIKAAFTTDKNFRYNVVIDDESKELVIDFFKIDFRKKDSDYQKKMIILNHNARHGNK